MYIKLISPINGQTLYLPRSSTAFSVHYSGTTIVQVTVYHAQSAVSSSPLIYKGAIAAEIVAALESTVVPPGKLRQTSGLQVPVLDLTS